MYKSPTLSFDGIIGIKTAAEDFVDFELRNGIRFLKSSKHLFLFSSLNRSLVDILNLFIQARSERSGRRPLRERSSEISKNCHSNSHIHPREIKSLSSVDFVRPLTYTSAWK